MIEFSVSITFLKTDFSSLIFLPSPVGCSLLISTLISPDSSLSANSSCQEVSRSYLLLKDKKYDFFVYRIPFLQKLCSFLQPILGHSKRFSANVPTALFLADFFYLFLQLRLTFSKFSLWAKYTTCYVYWFILMWEHIPLFLEC